ncbi:hypothetical protein HKX48_006582 [Thoreauomyces humboldtii]|nr:hypothetical protein HKX48_006582 [Thoreauomyces humboldtii]
MAGVPRVLSEFPNDREIPLDQLSAEDHEMVAYDAAWEKTQKTSAANVANQQKMLKRDLGKMTPSEEAVVAGHLLPKLVTMLLKDADELGAQINKLVAEDVLAAAVGASPVHTRTIVALRGRLDDIFQLTSAPPVEADPDMAQIEAANRDETFEFVFIFQVIQRKMSRLGWEFMPQLQEPSASFCGSLVTLVADDAKSKTTSLRPFAPPSLPQIGDLGTVLDYEKHSYDCAVTAPVASIEPVRKAIKVSGDGESDTAAFLREASDAVFDVAQYSS